MITPATSIQIPLRISQTVRLMTMPTIIGLQTVSWATAEVDSFTWLGFGYAYRIRNIRDWEHEVSRG